MKIIKEGILAFTRTNDIVSFDTRDEYDHTDIHALNINHIFATPSDMVEKFKCMEDQLEALEKEREDRY